MISPAPASVNQSAAPSTLIHALASADVYAALHSRPAGLSAEEARQRTASYGANVLHELPRKPFLVRFAANFTHLMALLLWAGGLIGFFAQMPQLGIAVWMVNLINGVFSFWQEYRAEKATDALQRMLPSFAIVIRDGQQRRIPAADLVPGDVLVLSEGDHISADARLVEDAELRVDQSTLSGEARPVRKSSQPVTRAELARVELPNLIFAGTNVAVGTGKAVIIATGMDTEFGKIAHLTQSMGDDLSPLQREMQRATKTVTVLAVSVGVLFLLLALLMARMSFAEGFIFALGMIVAFVPEGMLPTVTLALALGVQRMARRNALVKRLSAVETLGCTTVICTDKTGTLTQNEMTVQQVWLPAADGSTGRRFTVTGVGYAPEGQVLQDGQAAGGDPDLRQLLLAATLCNNARLVRPAVGNARWTAIGDPTEAALHVVAIKAALDPDAEGQRAPRLRELPFDSRRKRMSTIHQMGARRQVYTKGAPREILALCSHYAHAGRCCPLTDAQGEQIMVANDDLAQQGLRVLAVAMRTLPPDQTLVDPPAIEADLTFLGLIAMLDPQRPEVAQAVSLCHAAGIRIIMITGDYGLTAASIARRIGIVRGDQPRIVTGAELDGLDEAALRAVLQGEVIFARVAPEHKMRITAALQASGHVVAVTGDGVNDAPALKKADIGVAMGSGTDVAKEAADMVLADDNFASIVNAIEEGRAVYANIKKFITYIFTSNMPEAVPFILLAFSGGRIPLALTVMQVLAIDLGTDMVPALALGAERPEPGIMHKPPRSLREHVITVPLLLRALAFVGLIQGALAMLAFYVFWWTNGYAGQWLDLPNSGVLYQAATAITLSSVVTTQIGNLFAQRTERDSALRLGLFNNPLIWGGIAAEVLLLLAIIYLPPLQAVFGTTPFPPGYWLFLMIWIPVPFIADELRKFILRRLEQRALTREVATKESHS